MAGLTKDPGYASTPLQKKLNYVSPFSDFLLGSGEKTQETESVIYDVFFILLFSILSCKSGIIASAFMIH